MGSVLIWPNFTTVLNVIFPKIYAMTRERNILSRKKVIVQIKMYSLVSYRCNFLWHTCILWKMEFSCQFHTKATHDNKNPLPSYWYFLQTNQKNCLHLSLTNHTEICSIYIQKCIFPDHFMKYISIISFPGSLSFDIHFFPLRPFSSALIRVTRQCPDVHRQCLGVSRQCKCVS